MRRPRIENPWNRRSRGEAMGEGVGKRAKERLKKLGIRWDSDSGECPAAKE
jgi:hypothetical protein